ncbi:thioredoxin family protein [Mycoplasmopsis lipofaciens]|uniref:thioredoxin family protein n=1 Tax=Mycoplasmopsis lipofaciens TaxID=114884 RepID=UPI00047FEE43|nr:thioredoxin family protein [Mycoplasmopsis lipofaciens]
MLKDVKKEEYLDLVSNLKGLHVLVFHAQWCPPCKMFKNTLEELAEKDNIPVFRVDIDIDKEFAVEKGVSSIPAWMIIKDNTIVEKGMGFVPYEAFKTRVFNHEK